MKLSALSCVLLALPLAGCGALRGEGDESLSVQNLDVAPLNAVITVTQHEGEFRIFGENIRLQVGERRDFALTARPGEHTVALTTSTSIQESLILTIPASGDTGIEIIFRRGSASITTTQG